MHSRAWMCLLTWNMVLLFLVLLCAGLPAARAAEQNDCYAGVKRSIKDTLQREMKKQHVVGLSIALVDDQQVVWTAGFGYTDAATRAPATPDTLYRIGSITKVFTATEVMRLVEQGKVALDQPLQQYVPEFSIRDRFPNSKPITVRALLAHHSGLPSDRLAGMWVQHPVSLATLVTQLQEESLATAPQTQYKYSNLDFSLLGRLIEKVEGKDYASAMQQHLLVPLEMTDSTFQVAPETEKRYAKGYRNGKEADRTPLRDAPAGSMVSSVNDMSKFLRCLFAQGQAPGARIISEQSLKTMWTPQFPGLPLDFDKQVGCGWMLNGLTAPAGEQLVWHNGGAIPFQAHLSLLPARKLGVIILANTDEASKFITDVGVKTLAMAQEARYGKVSSATPTPPKPVKLSPDAVRRFAGAYTMFNGQFNKITADGGRLQTTLFDQHFSLVPISEDTFIPRVSALFGLVTVSVSNLTVQFQTVEGHDIALLRGLPAPYAFEKLTPVELSPAWRNRLGSYRADTTDEVFDFTNFELSSEKGFFVANVTMTPKDHRTPDTITAIALRPISDTEAVIAGLGDGEGGVLRVLDDGEKGTLLYSGYRFTRDEAQK